MKSQTRLLPSAQCSQLIRPDKSRLGMLYVEGRTVMIDLHIVVATGMSSFDRIRALASLQRMLGCSGPKPDLVELAGRSAPLTPTPPPGADAVVMSVEPLGP